MQRIFKLNEEDIKKIISYHLFCDTTHTVTLSQEEVTSGVGTMECTRTEIVATIVDYDKGISADE